MVARRLPAEVAGERARQVVAAWNAVGRAARDAEQGVAGCEVGGLLLEPGVVRVSEQRLRAGYRRRLLAGRQPQRRRVARRDEGEAYARVRAEGELAVQQP